MRKIQSEEFNTLPQNIQEEVKQVLKSYDSAYVTFNFCKFHVTTGIGIYSEYASDDRFVGKYNACELFTEAERKENFKESFGYYPSYILAGSDTH